MQAKQIHTTKSGVTIQGSDDRPLTLTGHDIQVAQRYAMQRTARKRLIPFEPNGHVPIDSGKPIGSGLRW